jgi:peptide/nickel transport system permease protein
MVFARLLRAVAVLVTTVLLAGLLGAALIRYSPGYGVDEHYLDASQDEAARAERAAARYSSDSLLPFYARYLRNAASGDFGVSTSYSAPVSQLIAERFPVTVRLAGCGLGVAWITALGAAALLSLLRSPLADAVASLGTTALVCAPAALVALVFLWWNGPAALALACCVFPRIFRYTRNLFAEASAKPDVLAARARGIAPSRVFFSHLLPHAAPGLIALCGSSVNLVLGAAVPIEALCDQPGIGQMAWKAALARDLPALVALTLTMATLTLTANAIADVMLAVVDRDTQEAACPA